MRFMDTFDEMNRKLTYEGKIVLSVEPAPQGRNVQEIQPSLKEKLNALHLRKIDLADEILVLNVGGYIGETTQREIAYAIQRGKPVQYLEEIADKNTKE